MTTDPISDLLTRLRNGARAGHPTVVVPASTTKQRILALLLEEGYLDRIEEFKDANGHANFRVYLRYSVQGKAVIRESRRLSKPGKRRFVSKDQIPQNKGGLGLYIISTSRGMLSDTEARKQGVGGELICSVF